VTQKNPTTMKPFSFHVHPEDDVFTINGQALVRELFLVNRETGEAYLNSEIFYLDAIEAHQKRFRGVDSSTMIQRNGFLQMYLFLPFKDIRTVIYKKIFYLLAKEVPIRRMLFHGLAASFREPIKFKNWYEKIKANKKNQIDLKSI
jgi:hypothetical protein